MTNEQATTISLFAEVMAAEHHFEQTGLLCRKTTLMPRLHDTTSCQTCSTTGWTTGCIV